MRAATLVLSSAMVAIGIALIAVGAGRDDVVRVVVGLLFIAAGAGRLYLQRGGR